MTLFASDLCSVHKACKNSEWLKANIVLLSTIGLALCMPLAAEDGLFEVSKSWENMGEMDATLPFTAS